MGRLDGKVVLITGAASGMGRATARIFAREGASVVIADIDRQGGEAAREECLEAGGEAEFEHCDVTREEDVERTVSRTVRLYGRLTTLYNNAGLGRAPPVEQTTAEEWDAAHVLILRSAVFGMKYAIPVMRTYGGGSIISTASDAGIRALPGQHAYAALKAGVIKLTEAVAQDVGRDGIRVNCIAPGWINTGGLAAGFPGGDDTVREITKFAQPIPRGGEPEDIAYAALFLASDESSFVTGVTLPVDGGWLTQGLQNAALMQELRTVLPDTAQWLA